jgi:hypothetical protein
VPVLVPELVPVPVLVPEPRSGPMAEFDEPAVQSWVAAVAGLTLAARAAVSERMAVDEYEGAELVGCTAKMLRKLLKGSDAEAAVPALLAARDTHLAAERRQQQDEAAAKAAPSCGVCFEPYSAAAVPRILVCGHTFCESCLSQILRCVQTYSN